MKADFIGLYWMAMWAGDNITPIPDIMRRAHDHLKSAGRQENWTDHAVASALSRAYQEEERHRATALYLSIFDLDMATFRESGVEMFGEAAFTMKMQQIESFDLGLTFLVCGFHGVTPSLFTVGPRGIVDYYTKPGYWAIGSGEYLARASLVLRQHRKSRTLIETIYAVAEAKFAAELAAGVGKHTTIGLLTFGNVPRLMSVDEIAVVRAAWERDGRPAMPDKAITVIRDWLGEPTLSDEQRVRRLAKSDPQSPTGESSGQPA